MEATVKAVGQTAMYAAQPRAAADECDPGGQKLTPWSYNWQWSSQNAEVATVSNTDTGEIPKYCTSSCTLAGSATVAAVCGDGVVQQTYEECDGGDGCTAECLHAGTKAPVCGNGKIDEGEDCDDGNAASGD